MKNNLNIVAYCSIKNHVVALNGIPLITKDHDLTFSEFSKEVYKELKMDYSKFFKMDDQCKLAILISEILFNHIKIDSKNKENIAIVLSNRSASLNTDRKYQETISNKENYYPSPAVFVYTLPNITIGEICIKHKIKGENVFFVSEAFNATLLKQYASCLFQNKKSKQILCGWIDFDDDQYQAFLYLVSEHGNRKFNQKSIKKIYNENIWMH